MDALVRDLRFALRGLSRTPGFTAAAVVALALGIGATTAIFSVVHAVLLRSLGWGDESRLVSVYRTFAGIGSGKGGLSVPELYDLPEAKSLESLGAFNRGTGALQSAERAERVPVARVTSGFFTSLAVRPQIGRAFGPEEDLKGSDGVALISAATFRRRFGGDPAVIGRSVVVDGQSRQIIGVLPEGFSYAGTYEFFVPYGFTETQRLGDRGAHYLEVMARLRPGIPLAAANEEIEQLSMRIAEMHPDNYPPEMKSVLHVEPLRERFVASSRQPILVLFGAVLLVLLIACGNVANLLLARSAVREREFAVRSALGAERSRIVRQLLTEGLLLSALGAFLGVLLATWGLDVLLAVAPRQIRQVGEVRIDRAVLAFSAGLTIATTLVFALVPALRASRVDLASSLKDGGRGSGGAPGARLRRALVIAQVALCLFLLVGAGLLIRSFAQILRVSPGFDPEGAIAADLIPAGSAYADPDARERYFEETLRVASQLPGVTAAGEIFLLPTRGKWGQTIEIEGYERAPGEPLPTDEFRSVLPGYFAAMGQRVVAGRDFSAADDAKAPLVVLVNEAWARRYFPGALGDTNRRSAAHHVPDTVVGRRIKVDTDRHRDAFWTIVGVVSDAREYGLDQPVPPVFYWSSPQEPQAQMTLVARGRVTAAALREVLSRVDPAQPLDRVLPLEDVLSTSLAARRFPLQLLGVFAALALVLSAVGIYGVTAYAVAQRTREIGVRMAVGASAGRVVRMVLASALGTVGIGLAIGAAAALAGGRLIASQLYGVSARDPLTFAGIAALLGLVALVASGIPALRAARIDPMAALRTE
ncbi:MAG TPA: ABC transporter permease [Myxococcales bacterium]|nr:ABC transporter permease [Myxococcales bacterium]